LPVFFSSLIVDLYNSRVTYLLLHTPSHSFAGLAQKGKKIVSLLLDNFSFKPIVGVTIKPNCTYKLRNIGEK
jgi:hypothetical protein